MKIVAMVLVLLICGLAPAFGSEISEIVDSLAPDVQASDMRSEVEFLADDASGGRLTGTDGAERAARFIAAAFKAAGLSPAPGMSDFFQSFDFTSGTRLLPDQTNLDILSPDLTTPPELGKDYHPLSFSGNGAVEGDVVFVGFGLVEPVDDGYDSYMGLDVKDKIVLCLRDLPEDVSSERRQELALYAGDRYKAKLAADRGAKAFLLVIGPNSPNGMKLIRLNEKNRSSSIPIPAISITGDMANALVKDSQTDLQSLQDGLDGGAINPHAPPVKAGSLRLEVELEKLSSSCRNVVGYLPPIGNTDEIIVVGAHYDHIGTGGEGMGSLAKQDEIGQIHNGADDNASGTAVVLELAASLSREAESSETRRGLLFACWSGEEIGLVGSSHFSDHAPVPLDRVVAYFNMDMVGRLRDNKLIVQAVASSPAWRGMIERRNIPAGFNLSLQNDPYLPTDLTSFYTKDIPGLAFFTDLHEDYNRPTDDPETLNYDGMVRIANFVRSLIRDAAEIDRSIEHARVQEAAAPSSRMGRRTFTGIIPDFSATSEEGMSISDVSPGGPAEEAGLAGGDIIVEFAGKAINSLQDYADALRGAKAGEPVTIVVLREKNRLDLTITPRVREQ